MKSISIAKASAISDNDPELESATIFIDKPVDEIVDRTASSFYKNAKSFYDSQAQQLIDVLASTLPQGTLDAVLYRLMEKKASLYIVAMDR